MKAKTFCIDIAVPIAVAWLILLAFTEVSGGLSECWWLSSSCKPYWDAWAAIGTAAAVGVALWIQRHDIHRRTLEAKAAEQAKLVAEKHGWELLWWHSDRVEHYMQDLMNNRLLKAASLPDDLSKIRTLSLLVKDLANETVSLIPLQDNKHAAIATTLTAQLRSIAHDLERISSEHQTNITWDLFKDRMLMAPLHAMKTATKIKGKEDAPADWLANRRQTAAAAQQRQHLAKKRDN